VIHEREGLALGLEPCHDLFGVHPWLDDLERYAAPHWSFLLGDLDLAHASFADLLKELIRADPSAGALRDRARAGGRGASAREIVGCEIDRGTGWVGGTWRRIRAIIMVGDLTRLGLKVKQPASQLIRFQEHLDASSQTRIACAHLVEEGRALTYGFLKRSDEEVAFVHGSPPVYGQRSLARSSAPLFII
jgi:hypothetical protein